MFKKMLSMGEEVQSPSPNLPPCLTLLAHSHSQEAKGKMLMELCSFWGDSGRSGEEAWRNIKDAIHSCLLLIIIIPFSFLSG